MTKGAFLLRAVACVAVAWCPLFLEWVAPKLRRANDPFSNTYIIALFRYFVKLFSVSFSCAG